MRNTAKAPKAKPTGTYRKIDDSDVQIAFTKNCDCDTDNVMKMFPCDIVYSGTPICQECGDLYNYNRTEVR